MKKYFILSLLTGLACISGNSAFAKSDLELIAEFYFNATSGGSYLAEMEGEKEKIRLEIEKRKAELLRDSSLEAERQLIAYYQNLIDFNRDLLKKQNETLMQLNTSIQQTEETYLQMQELVIFAKKTELSLKEILRKADLATHIDAMALRAIVGDGDALANIGRLCQKEGKLNYCAWLLLAEKGEKVAQNSRKLVEEFKKSELITLYGVVVKLYADLKGQQAKVEYLIKFTEHELVMAHAGLARKGG